jgi:hypothetical protein
MLEKNIVQTHGDDMKVHNNNCDGDHCNSSTGEVRLLPYGGGGNLILCRSCYDYEIAWRKDQIKRKRDFETPEWESLEVYTGE